MTITLYQNLSESNVVDKDLNKLIDLQGTLREGTSITNPVITIQFIEAILTANYIYIHEFNRYYFITDIASIVNNLWAVSCHVDVLSTYKNQIRGLSAIIGRQEHEYNLYLEDDRLLTTSRRIYWTKAFPNRVMSAKDNPDSPSFIFTCAGGEEVAETTQIEGG